MPHFLAKKPKSSAFNKNQSASENAPLLCFKRLLENRLDFDNADNGVSKKSNNDLAQNLAKKRDSSLEQNLVIYPKLHSLKSNKLALIPIKKNNAIFFCKK